MFGLRDAVSFLTRFPTGTPEAGLDDVARSVPWFPVVGGLVGLVVAGVYAAALIVLPAFVAAALAVAVGILATGAFHEDGLADTADAFCGGWTKEEVLGIMKDPTHGTYGVTAIALSLVLRTGALASLDGWETLAALTAAHALSRGSAVALMGALNPATEEGLGASYAAKVTRVQVAVGIIAALVIGGAALGPWVAAAAPCAALPALVVGRLATKKIGGITGDVLGAAQQGAEVAVLLFVAATADAGWAELPWWQ